MYDKKKKYERIDEHFRLMAKRKRINEEIRKVRGEAADKRKGDKGYHEMVLQRWAAMNGHSKEVAVSNEVQS